jgi:DNA (cytosine-5)-methyltransferase 1
MIPLTYGSVCSGIEGASVAWAPLGWRCAFTAETEAFPRAVLKHHYPDVPLFSDFTRLRDHHQDALVDVDLLVGGTPCQGFSVAGLRGSLSDDRSNLCLEFIRLANTIDHLRRAAGRPPIWVLWENVPGVFSTEDNAFGAFLGGLVGCDAALDPGARGKWTDAGLAAGPDRMAAWRVLDAQHFGLAQRRRRVFVLALGGAGAWACADALLPLADSLSGYPAPRRQARERAAPTISARASAGGGLGTDFDLDGGLIDTAPTLTAAGGTDRKHGQGYGQREYEHPGFLQLAAFGGNNTSGEIDVTAGLLAQPGSGWKGDFDSETFITHALNTTATGGAVTEDGTGRGVPLVADHDLHSLRADGFDASEDGTGRGTPLVASTLRPPSRDATWRGDGCDNLIAFSTKDSGADIGEDISPTLRAGEYDTSHANGGVMPAIAFNWQNGGGYGEAHDGLGITEDGTGPLDASTIKAVAIPITADAARRGEGVALTPSPDAEGRIRLRDPGLGIGEDGDPAPTLQAGGPGAVFVHANKGRPAGRKSAHTEMVTLEDETIPTLTTDGHVQSAVFTLAARGRDDGTQLEFRDDELANAVLTPSGGRAGIGVGAIAYAPDVSSTVVSRSSRGGGQTNSPGYNADQALVAIADMPTAQCARTGGPLTGWCLGERRPDGVWSTRCPDCEPRVIGFDAVQLTSLENRSNPQPGDPAPTLAQGSQPMIAFGQNTRDELQIRGGDGDLAGSVQGPGTHQTTYVAAVDLQNVSLGGDVAGTLDTTRPTRGGGQAVMNTFADTAPTLSPGHGGASGHPHRQIGNETGLVAFTITPSQSNKDFNARPSERTQALTPNGNRVSARGGDVIAIQGAATRENPASGPDGVGVRTDGVAYTVEARAEVQMVATSAVRRLTPTECERLQGFPDGYTDVPFRGKAAADGPRYKALGNSFAAPVISWIGQRIQAVR